MKTMLFLVCSTFFSFAAIAQTNDPSVLASAGGINSNSKLSLEWTLGETSISTISYGKNILTEGFHQPIIIIAANRKPEIVSATIKDLEITIAPNPVFSVLTVKFKGGVKGNMTLTLIDATGKPLLSKQHSIKSSVTTIGMEQLPGGVYFLRINDSKGIIKTFEIIKL